MNYKVVIWHGEARSLTYVVEADALEGEQPAVLHTAHSYEEAVAVTEALKAGKTFPVQSPTERR